VASVFEIDARRELARITVPILYLRGTRDRLVPASASREVHGIARQTVITDIDAPHFLLQSKPVDAAQAIRRFVSTCA
jgi:pimeloyl-ACP methyl ester carboxylesterase